DRSLAVAVTAAAAAFDREAETLALEGLRTDVGGVVADWQLSAAALLDAPAAEGSVRATGDTAALFELAVLQPPSGGAPSELGPFTASSSFAWSGAPAEVRLADLALDVLGMQIRGEGSLRAAEHLQGRIAIAEFAPNAAVQALLRGAVPPTVDVSALDRL